MHSHQSLHLRCGRQNFGMTFDENEEIIFRFRNHAVGCCTGNDNVISGFEIKDSEIRFMEASAGAPPAVRTWWYPGERTGYEFIYPKNQARRIAQRTKQDVLTTKADSTTAQQTNTEDLTRVSASGDEIQVAGNGITEETPSGSCASHDTNGPGDILCRVIHT